jgi:8-oxo-dGTP pyrophosphatase MutT (NUDIX family)
MTKNEKNIILPAVFLVMKQNNKILLLRRFNTGFQDGQYTFPSGHVERNESPLTAVCREAREEVGVDVHSTDVKLEQVLYRKGYNIKGIGFDNTQIERVDFFFSTERWTGNPNICEPNKCDDVRWFPITALPKNTFPVVKAFLKTYPNQQIYADAGYK